MTVYAIGNLISTFSSGIIGVLYLGRLVTGLGVGALTVVGPMAIVEIAPSTIRGLMTLWFNVCMLSSQMIGIFVVYGCSIHVSSGSNLQYQITFFVQTFVPAIVLVLSCFLYESPRWLCLKGKEVEARESLIQLRGLAGDHPFLEAEFTQISQQIAIEKAEYPKETFMSQARETFCVRSNLRRVQLTVMAYLLAQMSGANAVTNYLPSIFGLIGVKGTGAKIYSSGLYALVKLVFCVAASLFFVEIIGRRKSLMIGVTVQMGCFAYLAGFLNIFKRSPNSISKGAADMAIASIYIHAFGWAIGMLPALQTLFLTRR
jgi:Sugar (and other) transporter